MRYKRTGNNMKTKRLTYLHWLNDIQNCISEFEKKDYEFSFKENLVSLNWYMNKKQISTAKMKLKNLLSIGLEHCYQLPSFMIDQYGEMLPEIIEHNKSVVKKTNSNIFNT